MKLIKMLLVASVVTAIGIQTVSAGGGYNDGKGNIVAYAENTNDVSQPCLDSSILTKNLYIDAGAGVAKVDGKSSALNAAIGVNNGFQFTKFNNGAILGLQAGGSIGTEENSANDLETVYQSSVGVFLRGIPIEYDRQLAGAVLFVYDHNVDGANLLSLRPLAGVALDKKNSLGSKGSIHLNRDNHDEATDSAAGFYTRKWNSKWTSELEAGYRWSDVNAAYVGSTWAYSINKTWDLVASVERDANSDYAAFFKIVYGFGGKGIHSSIDNVAGTEATPFPTR